MQQFISYPSIDQYRNVIKAVNSGYAYIGQDENGETILDRTLPKPTIEFSGTVKLHGTNAAVVINNEDMYFQSRNRIITPLDDNAGFAAFAHSRRIELMNMLMYLKAEYDAADEDYIAIFGEWCGGNIQKGVALSQLDKRFVIFGARLAKQIIKDEVPTLEYTWLDHSKLEAMEEEIYNIENFPKFNITIDFNQPELYQNTLVSNTEMVEKTCPFGKAFGVEGVGEGIVYKGWFRDNLLMFKVKGEEHSTSKVKTLSPVDTEELENISKFVDYAVTESRLNQAIEYVFTQNNLEVDVKHLGSFIKWVVEDVIKEELDTITDNGLNIGKIKKEISNAARKWFMNLPF